MRICDSAEVDQIGLNVFPVAVSGEFAEDIGRLDVAVNDGRAVL